MFLRHTDNSQTSKECLFLHSLSQTCTVLKSLSLFLSHRLINAGNLTQIVELSWSHTEIYPDRPTLLYFI